MSSFSATRLARRRLGLSLAAALMAVFVVAGVLVALVDTLMANAARNAKYEAGYGGHVFGPGIIPPNDPNDGPTAGKPQTLLWFHDRSWWGILFNPAAGLAGEYHIYRLRAETQTWVDTQVLVDTRRFAHADTLWDGHALYVVTAAQPARGNTDLDARLMRFTYEPGAGTYALDPGFPIVLARGAMEAIVVSKDSTGTLWSTFTYDNQPQGRSVYILHSTTGEVTWTQPYVLPASGADDLADDDIAGIVSYNRQTGIMWSNQHDGALYFAVHQDGAGDDQWRESVVLHGQRFADDHINLKGLDGDGAGQVFAAVKTSMDEGPDPDPAAPLIMLLVLDGQGNWRNYTFGTVAEHHTRPIVVIDQEQRKLYMFAVSNRGNVPSAVYYKATSLDAISFPPGLGTLFVGSAGSGNINNPTAARQPVSSATGLVILASDLTQGRYVHNFLALATPPAATRRLYLPLLADHQRASGVETEP